MRRKATPSEKKMPNPRYFRKLRRGAGLTQKAAQLAAGRAEPHCAYLEHGRCTTTLEIFRRYMKAFGAGPFESLTCLDLNPFDLEILRRFRNRCKKEKRDPVTVLETLMRFYAAQ